MRDKLRDRPVSSLGFLEGLLIGFSLCFLSVIDLLKPLLSLFIELFFLKSGWIMKLDLFLKSVSGFTLIS